MKWLLTATVAIGCGAEKATPTVTSTQYVTAAAVPATSIAKGRELATLEDALRVARKTEEVLDSLFENVWHTPPLHSKAACDHLKARIKLNLRLEALDDRMDAFIADLKTRRLKDAVMRNECEHEAILLRQQIINDEANVEAADKLLNELIDATNKLIKENNKLESFSGLRERANAEAEGKAREAQKPVAALRLKLEKSRRMLRVYE